MSVEIDPLELSFRRPFTVEVGQILRIKNPNAAPVAFKVKTTAPKQYCVRPNSGRIEPGHEVEVSVLLQAMKQEPPLDVKCRDKFLVQSVTITGDKEFTNVSQIWDTVEKSAIQEKKIRVSWLPPSDEGRLPQVSTPGRRPVTNGAEATPDTAPSAYSPNNDTTVIDDSGPAAQPPQPERKESKQEHTMTPSTQHAPPAFSTPAVAAAKSAAAETYEELREKLARAEATIASLKNDAAAAGGLRQRKPAASEPEQQQSHQEALAHAQVERQATEGVPVQIVAILCLASFLLAYFLF